MSKKKVLFIITHLELGGAQKQLFYLLEDLDKDKYSLYLCCGDSGHLKEKFLGLPYVQIKFIPSLVREINPLLDLITFFKLFSFIKKHRFDTVHTHSPKASFLGRWAAFFCGVKNIVYTVHAWPFHRFMNPIFYYIVLFLEKITAKITKKIIVVSKADYQEAIKKKISAPDKLTLMHYGIEIDKFNHIFEGRTSGDVNYNLIISVSSLKPQKGIFYFLEMANCLVKRGYNLQFLIVGDGPYRGKILKKISSLGLQRDVLLKGWVDDVSPLFSKASIFILSSLWEGLPVSVIEAVISGVPAVVTNTGGVCDMVKNYRNGIIVEPKDVEELSEAVITILNNYDEWSRIVQRHRKDINLAYWSQERMVKEIDSLYGVLK